MKPLCLFCGVSIVGLRSDARYCSARCRIYFRRRGVPVGPLEETPRLSRRDERKRIVGERRRLVFERDGWVCHLCGEQIDRNARYPEPLSGVLDHVIARSRGGSDGEDNLKASHARCNSKKSHLDIDVFLQRAAS